MDSKISKDADKDLVALTQQLSPEERVNAFLEHCRSMMDLFEAGQQLQARRERHDP